MQTARRGTSVALAALVIVALAVFLVKGAGNALRDSGDFGTPYAAARAWAGGGDPYQDDNLVLPLAWAFSALRTPARRFGWATLALLAPFLLHGVPSLQDFAASGRVPPSVAASAWWNVGVLPFAVWDLLLLALCLLAVMAAARPPARDAVPA